MNPIKYFKKNPAVSVEIELGIRNPKALHELPPKIKATVASIKIDKTSNQKMTRREEREKKLHDRKIAKQENKIIEFKANCEVKKANDEEAEREKIARDIRWKIDFGYTQEEYSKNVREIAIAGDIAKTRARVDDEEAEREKIASDIRWKKNFGYTQEEYNKNAMERAEEYKKNAGKRAKEEMARQIEAEARANVFSFFNAIEGGETTLYYLRLLYKEKRYYKIGVTLNSVRSRYKTVDFKFIDKILYEKKVTHANTIEQQIIKKFREHAFPLAILSSGQTEVFDYDILQMDVGVNQ